MGILSFIHVVLTPKRLRRRRVPKGGVGESYRIGRQIGDQPLPALLTMKMTGLILTRLLINPTPIMHHSSEYFKTDGQCIGCFLRDRDALINSYGELTPTMTI